MHWAHPWQKFWSPFFVQKSRSPSSSIAHSLRARSIFPCSRRTFLGVPVGAAIKTEGIVAHCTDSAPFIILAIFAHHQLARRALLEPRAGTQTGCRRLAIAALERAYRHRAASQRAAAETGR
eukprot:scaffold41143_cov65-Phaeocystis_antarctica.AAC.5